MVIVLSLVVGITDALSGPSINGAGTTFQVVLGST
jgi:hypothetical protein